MWPSRIVTAGRIWPADLKFDTRVISNEILFCFGFFCFVHSLKKESPPGKFGVGDWGIYASFKSGARAVSGRVRALRVRLSRGALSPLARAAF